MNRKIFLQATSALIGLLAPFAASAQNATSDARSRKSRCCGRR